MSVAFNRDKDWLDIRSMLIVQGERIDVAYLKTWLEFLFDSADTRVAAFDRYLNDIGDR